MCKKLLLICWLMLVLPALAACSNQAATWTSPVDSKVMVRVPAGQFRIGTDSAQATRLNHDFGLNAASLADEMPAVSASLPEFYIDQTPVTNAEYKRFLDAHPERPVPFLGDDLAAAFNWDKVTRLYPAGREQYPVVLVTWQDAAAYCAWAGKRLPSEAEWEKAARGTDGRIWPWGNQWDPTRLNSVEGHKGDLVPAGQYPAGSSPYGALDMTGNIWQWTSSLDKPYPYQAADGREDPNAAGARITRGGSWLFGAAITRTATRNRLAPLDAVLSVGFRCARSTTG
jgi:formylglycine-generating enzyme required for sulfatase activity